MSMSVTLSKSWGNFVQQLVASGRYASADDAVDAGLYLLEVREKEYQVKLEELRQLIKEGQDSGTPKPFDDFAIKAEIRRRRATRV